MPAIPADLPAWQSLQEQQKKMAAVRISDMFAQDAERANKFSLTAAGVSLDYSKNLINEETIAKLVELARQTQLAEAIDAMFNGETINGSEKRAVLHVALRDKGQRAINIGRANIATTVQTTLQAMQTFADKIHSAEITGCTGKPLRTLVNIGIGGSYLGPKVVSDALKPYWQKGYGLKYIANIDGTDLCETLKSLDYETTLFVIASKSFSTLETLKNAQAARQWFLQQGGTDEQVKHHFVAVSTNIAAAVEFGISAENIFPLWDWVGGRYSLWSAVGLAQMIVLGPDNFSALLAGAHAMDEHFRGTPLAKNLPVILALLGVWYQNFFAAESHAILTYDTYLESLPMHLQQADMESNGKRVSRDGGPVSCQTGAVIWGGAGTNGQHAYHQLLHQGTRLIPTDFIMPLRSHNPVADHHDWLFANYLGQQQALVDGKSQTEIEQELIATGYSEAAAKKLAPHKVIPGNRPCNSITINLVTPQTLGALLAMYEHKIFVQGIIWDVNSFDQWGVELGKVLGNRVYEALKSGNTNGFNGSAAALIKKFRQANSLD